MAFTRLLLSTALIDSQAVQAIFYPYYRTNESKKASKQADLL
jgi:hypothetical protein